MSTNFKTCLFGGFDRADVVAFIEKTARETQERIAALANENEELKRSHADRENEWKLLQEQSAAAQEKQNRELAEQLKTLQERYDCLQREVEELRAQAVEYQSLKDHIAEIEISAHRRTEEFRAAAIAKLRESIDQQRAWCEKSRDEYQNMNEQLSEKLAQAREMLAAPDMSGFDRMDQELQELSDSFDA